MCAVQANREGIRVGDLVNDFDVFTQKYALSSCIVLGWWSLAMDIHWTDVYAPVIYVPLYGSAKYVLSMSVCLSACIHQKTTCPIFVKFTVNVTCGRDVKDIFNLYSNKRIIDFIIRLEARLQPNSVFTLEHVLAFLDFRPPWLCNDYRSPEIHY